MQILGKIQASLHQIQEPPQKQAHEVWIILWPHHLPYAKIKPWTGELAIIIIIIIISFLHGAAPN